MRRRRRLIIAGAVLLVAAALTVIVLLRREAPPESVRLLPEAEAVIHVNFRLVRRVGGLEGFSETIPETEYQEFVRETGFRFERDLDEMAMAVHAPAAPGVGAGGSPTGTGARPGAGAEEAGWVGETRFSHVFMGRFDSAKLSIYLRKLARATERYRELEVFHIPSEDRAVRVAILGVDTVAVSNAYSAQPLRDIIDHYKAVAAPHGGPGLVREHYGRVPRGSVMWAIARWAPAGGSQPVALGDTPLELTLPAQVTWVGSLRFLGELQLRVEALTASAAEARQLSDQLTNLLTLYRNLSGTQVADADVQAFIQSVEVQQQEQQAVVTATVSRALLKKALEEPAAPAEKTAPETPKKSGG